MGRQERAGTGTATVEVSHEGDPQRVTIVASGVRSNHSPPTALEQRAVDADKETGTFHTITASLALKTPCPTLKADCSQNSGVFHVFLNVRSQLGL